MSHLTKLVVINVNRYCTQNQRKTSSIGAATTHRRDNPVVGTGIAEDEEGDEDESGERRPEDDEAATTRLIRREGESAGSDAAQVVEDVVQQEARDWSEVNVVPWVPLSG